MPPHICTCAELGCGAESFALDGVITIGRMCTSHNGKIHEAELRRLRHQSGNGVSSSLLEDTLPMNRRRRSLSASGLPIQRDSSFSGEPTQPSRRRSLSARPPTVISTEQYRLPDIFLQKPSCLISMLQVAKSSIKDRASHRSSRAALKLAKLSIEQACLELNYHGRPFWSDIPTTLPKLYNIFNLESNLTSEICCPECFALHGGQATSPGTYKLKCDNMRFFQTITRKKKDEKTYRQICDASLYDNKTLKPHRVFHYQSLRSWIAKMILLPGFEDHLDASIIRAAQSTQRDPTKTYDIWDGRMWKTFQISSSNSSVPYTSKSGNLVFGFFCDWFNPHGRGSQRHISSGNAILICYNLPPEMRYKQENIFLYGIIPGPQEPKTDQINHPLNPLVDEFMQLWDGVFLTTTPRHHSGRVVRAVIWPLIADAPGMRKIAGFASHSATLFCPHCALKRDDMDKIDITKWPERSDHQIHSEAWRDAETLEDQDKIFNNFGVQYSIFSKLPYWRPQEFVTVDIMHCVLLGILSDYSKSCIGIFAAGKKLKSIYESNARKGMHRAEHIQRNRKRMGSIDDLSDQIEAIHEERQDEESSVDNNQSSTDIEKDSEETDQSHSDIDRSTENIDESNEDIDGHTEDMTEHAEDIEEDTEDVDGITRDIDEGTEDTNGSSESERLINRTYNRKRGRSPVEVQKKRHRHIDTVNPEVTISIIPGKGKKRQLSQDSTSRPLRRSTRIQTSSGSSVTSYTSQRIIPAPLTKKKRKFTHPHISSSQNNVSSQSSILQENAGSILITQPDAISNAASISKSPARSDSNSTVRGFPNTSQDAPLPKDPKITVFLLEKLHQAAPTIVTPTWMTRLPTKIGMGSAGHVKATEWLVLYTVYMVLVMIPELYNSEDDSEKIICQSLIKLGEIVNCAFSRTFDQIRCDRLQVLLQDYRHHVNTHWKSVTIKSNLHVAQHLPEIATLYGPPSYTAGFAGERMNGSLIKTPTNRHLDELEKTLSNSFIRRGLFQSVLNNTSALLSGVDHRIRDSAVATLTGLHVPVWSKLTSIDQLTTYHTWFNYLNSDIDGRYGAFRNKFDNTATTDCRNPLLQDHVQTIQRLKIDGKFYNCAKTSKPHEGNTLVEFWLRKKKCHGRIKGIFRTSLIQTTFLQLEPFTELSDSDSNLNLYSLYPGLHATILYDKPAPQIVVDVRDIIGHFAAVFNLENTFGISEKTVSIVSLRNSDLLAAEIPATCET